MSAVLGKRQALSGKARSMATIRRSSIRDTTNPPSRRGTDYPSPLRHNEQIRCQQRISDPSELQSRHAPTATQHTDQQPLPIQNASAPARRSQAAQRHSALNGFEAAAAASDSLPLRKTMEIDRPKEATESYAALLSVDWLLLCLSNAFLYSGTLCHIAAACPFNGLSRLGSASKLWMESRIVRTL